MTAQTEGAPEPRSSTALFGHRDAERTLLQAYQAGRLPHAFLIGGEQGIGKATLAFRFARFILANPDPATPEVTAANSLQVEAEHPVARRIAARAHGDLLVLERTPSELGVLRTEIAVADVRRTVGFFGTTASAGGWRICIIDSADDLNRSGANALLKMIEEPPARSLFLIVSHAPGRLLPTIRSRCRLLSLKPLAEADVAAAAAMACGREAAEVQAAAAAAEGSVARAVALLGEGRLALRETLDRLLAQLPEADERALHALADGLGRANEGAFDLVIDRMQAWLSHELKAETAPARLARMAQVWEKLTFAARDTEVYNLERKPLIFFAFGLLATAATPPAADDCGR